VYIAKIKCLVYERSSAIEGVNLRRDRRKKNGEEAWLIKNRANEKKIRNGLES
jgi:hypothetical protein